MPTRVAAPPTSPPRPKPTRSQPPDRFCLRVRRPNTRRIIMTTQKLPGSDAARHGTGDADLTIMLAAHDAFRRDLTRLARTAGDASRRQSVQAGWGLSKRQLHLHPP